MRTINPLLIDKPATIEPQRRNFARKAEEVTGADFAQQLSDVEAKKAASADTAKSNYIKSANNGRVDRSASEFGDDDDDFGFDDLVDLVNPLQHIPVLGAVYRELTGDTIKPVAQIAGDVAYGALTGNIILSAATSIVSTAIEQYSGEDPITQVADALFGSDGEEQAPEIAVASATSSAPAEIAPKTDKVAAVSEAKLPYGGVMDTSAKSPMVNATSSMHATPAMRVGNTVYTSPVLGNAARVAPSSAGAATITSRAMPTALPGATPTNSQTLGSMMQESASSGSKNDKLPPDLVRDMMMMALDKYKTAEGLAPSEIKTSPQN